jgi:probable rRNA maturation factor
MAPDDGSRRRLRVLVSDEHGRTARAAGLTAWLRRVAPAAARGTVSIALVSTSRIRALNRTYRHQDRATDVLSFPAARPATGAGPPVALKGLAAAAPFLGDIVIARPVAKRQARAAGHSQTTELRVLALHGLLHLLGYDHEHDNGTMSRIERRLRRKGGLREGLIERAAPRRLKGRNERRRTMPSAPGAVRPLKRRATSR